MSERRKHRPKKYLRKKAVAVRYDVDIRTIDRMARDGRIPAPKYLHDSRWPIWEEAELEAAEPP